MKMVYPEWKKAINFPEGEVQVIGIEDPIYFSRIVSELVEQSTTGEGRFVLSDEDRILDMNKASEIILSPFQLDFSSKKIQNAIVRQMGEIAVNDEYLKTQEISSKILQYAYQIADHLDYSVEFDEEIDATQLFKLANLKVGYSQTSLVESITDYICITRKVLALRLIIGVNLKKFFSKEELQVMYKTVMLNKTALLLLEKTENEDRLDMESWLTIDRDLCEI